jgi:hypothetical protein
MSRHTKIHHYGLILFILTLTLLSGEIIGINSYSENINDKALQAFLVAYPDDLHQGEHFNMSLTISHDYFDDIFNVSLKVEIPEEIEFVDSSMGDLEVDKNASEFQYNSGIFRVEDRKIFFTVEYNVTSNLTKQVTLPVVNVSFLLRNGHPDWVISNTASILIKGEEAETETTTLRLLPEGDIPPNDLLIIAAYLIPITICGISIIYLRRLRRPS